MIRSLICFKSGLRGVDFEKRKFDTTGNIIMAPRNNYKSLHFKDVLMRITAYYNLIKSGWHGQLT